MSDQDLAASIQRAAVLGAGTMGHGIAQVLAMSGIETCLFDISEEAVADGLAKIAGNLDKGVARGKVSEEDKAGAGRAALRRRRFGASHRGRAGGGGSRPRAHGTQA